MERDLYFLQRRLFIKYAHGLLGIHSWNLFGSVVSIRSELLWHFFYQDNINLIKKQAKVLSCADC